MSKYDRKRVIKKIEKARGSKVISYITSDRHNLPTQINEDVIKVLYRHLSEIERLQSEI